MKRLAGLVLFIGGWVLVGLAVLRGVGEIRGLYEGAVADPMGEPTIAEEERPGRMLNSVLTGSLGLPLMGLGTYLMISGGRRRRSAGAQRLDGAGDAPR